jgi:flagellar biosynthesis GTPase FlhF
MELVRIIEKDDKTARDKVKKIYGNDCLIVSSSRIKNKSELVIAIDLDNQVDNIFLQKNKKQSPFDLNKLTTKKPQDDNNIKYLNSNELFEKQKANQLATDIKEEILALRDEFDRFKRNFSSNNDLLPENIANRLKNLDLPFTLFKFIEDELIKTESIEIASKNLEAMIKENTYLSNTAYPLSKKIVFYGPSGSGKTTNLFKFCNFLIDQHNISNEKICVLSYADEKPGSWSQVKTLGSKCGVDTYKIKNLEELKIILGDINIKYEKILIDTPGVNINEKLHELSFQDETLFYLLIPITASKIAFKKFINKLKPNCVFLTKKDETENFWEFISYMLENRFEFKAVTSSNLEINQYEEIDYHFLFNEIQQKILNDAEINQVKGDYFEEINYPEKNNIVN